MRTILVAGAATERNVARPGASKLKQLAATRDDDDDDSKKKDDDWDDYYYYDYW